MPHTCVAISLRHPVVDGLRSRLELLFQLLRPASGLHQFDQLRPKFRRVRGTMLGHNRHLLLQTIDVRFCGSTSPEADRLPPVATTGEVMGRSFNKVPVPPKTTGALAAAATAAAVGALWVRHRARKAERDNPPAGRFVEVDG